MASKTKAVVKQDVADTSQLVKTLSSFGAPTSGTLDELQSRLNTFAKTPGLITALQEEEKKRARIKVFGRELSDLPPNTISWKCKSFPSFTLQQLKSYAKPKLPGGQSRMEKGLGFFKSNKIVTMRIYEDVSKGISGCISGCVLVFNVATALSSAQVILSS